VYFTGKIEQNKSHTNKQTSKYGYV